MTDKDLRKKAKQILENYQSKLRYGDTEETNEIERAIDLLSDDFKDILKSRYLNKNPETLTSISLRKGWSYKIIQNWSAMAIIQSAEAYKKRCSSERVTESTIIHFH